MKKCLLTIMLLCSWAMVFGQNISGTWNGVLCIHSKQLKVGFNISSSGSGYSTTMDSPDQKAFGLSTKQTNFKDSVLSIKMLNTDIQYEGKLNSKGTFVGVLIQGGILFPLDLSKQIDVQTEVKTVERRPTNYNVYNYYFEEVTFENKKDNISLAGTISAPIGKSKFPVVILISAGGQHNRNEEQFGHKPFEAIADYLTTNGIGVLRFDDRGTAKSGGNFHTATTYDMATDVEAAVEYIKSRKDLNITSIGLVGHSEGGIIAPIVASKLNDISFMVLMAAPGVRGDELLLSQLKNTGELVGAGEMKFPEELPIDKGQLEIVRNSVDNEQLKEDLMGYIKKNIIQSSEKNSSILKDELIAKQINMLTSPWMISFTKLEPAKILQKVNCPVLALYGCKDIYVPAIENINALKSSLKASGNRKVKINTLKGLNHNFQECETGLMSEYSSIKQTISPDVLEKMGGWILQKARLHR